jgi:kinesin family protein 2/24
MLNQTILLQAAGITTPSALAELDVNHFEALGISDPNDRRKLFYLVQRIKMAVTKEASTTTKEVETMESKVDAMISGTMNIVDNAPAEGAGTSTPLRSKRSTKPKKEPSLTSALTSTTNKQKEVKKKKTPLLQSSPPIKKKKSTRKKTKKEGEDERMEEDPASSSSPKNSKPKKPKPKTTALSPTKTNEKTDTRDPSSSSSSKSSSLRVTQSPSKSTAAPSTTRTSPTPKTKSTTASPARGRPISQLRMPKASSPTHSPIRNSASKASSEELKSRLQTPKSRLRGPESKLPISSTTNQKSKMAKPRQSLLHTNTTTTAASSTTTSRQPPIDSFLQRERESPSTNLSDYTIVETTSSSSSDWPSQVEALRQDNHGEHELFCDSSSSQKQGLQEQYDMRIRVIVRKRPLSKKERSSSGSMDVIHPLDYGDFGKVLVYQPKTRVDLTKEVETVPFAYDNVFDESSNNVQIYQRSLRNLIQPFFKGQWSTVFAYGQTGSGKTYTMMGSNMTGTNAGTADSSNFGLYYLAALDIFELLQREENQHLKVTVSLFEIYAGKLFDLLHDRTPIKCLEDSKGKVCFPGLTQHAVQGPNRLMQLIQEGASNRSTGTTSRNADSSRSHAVLQLQLRKTVGRKPNVEHGTS